MLMAQGVALDWEAIHSSFVEGVIDVDGQQTWPNLREVAEIHKVNYASLRRKSADDRWLDERAAHQRFLQAQRREARARELAEVGVEFDGEAITDARYGLRLIGRRLQEMGVAATPLKERTPAQKAQYPELPFIPLNAKEMSALSSAAVRFQLLGKRGMGESESTSRMEVTGEGGGAVRADIGAKMRDPNRLVGLLTTALRAGLLDDFDPDEEVIEIDANGHAHLGAGDRGPLPAADDD